MLVAVSSAYAPTLNRAFDARAVDPASKSQYGVSLRVKEDVLLIDRSLQFSLLARALIVTGNNAALLNDLHDLRAIPAIGAF